MWIEVIQCNESCPVFHESSQKLCSSTKFHDEHLILWHVVNSANFRGMAESRWPYLYALTPQGELRPLIRTQCSSDGMLSSEHHAQALLPKSTVSAWDTLAYFIIFTIWHTAHNHKPLLCEPFLPKANCSSQNLGYRAQWNFKELVNKSRKKQNIWHLSCIHEENQKRKYNCQLPCMGEARFKNSVRRCTQILFEKSEPFGRLNYPLFQWITEHPFISPWLKITE